MILLQKATSNAFVEFPLMFTMQDESLSAFHQDNIAAKQALGRTYDQADPDFIVRTILPSKALECLFCLSKHLMTAASGQSTPCMLGVAIIDVFPLPLPESCMQ